MTTAISNDEKLVLAFYGFSLAMEDVEDLFNTIGGWFASLGFLPNMLSSNKHGKAGPFATREKALRREHFAGVTSFDIHSSPENSGITFDASATYSADDGGVVAIAIPASRPCREEWRDACVKLIGVLGPYYGIGYKRTLAYGPIWYALGINQSPKLVTSGPEYEEKVIVSRWLDVGMENQVYRDGTIRDVFPINFLSPVALGRDVGGITLREYIARPGHGTLTPVGDLLQLWELDDPQVERVRAELRATGIVFMRK